MTTIKAIKVASACAHEVNPENFQDISDLTPGERSSSLHI